VHTLPRIDAARDPDTGGYHDSLDGIPLQAGEKLHIRWPSGYFQEVPVGVDVTYIATSAGIPIKCTKVYLLSTTTYGATGKIYLVGFEAQRIT
jgi:hypothetical protein